MADAMRLAAMIEGAALGFAAGILWYMTACSAHRITIDAPPPVPAGDAGDICARACAVLAAYCDDGRDPRCADACRVDQAQGIGAQLRPECVVEAGTLSAVQQCGGCL